MASMSLLLKRRARASCRQFLPMLRITISKAWEFFRSEKKSTIIMYYVEINAHDPLITSTALQHKLKKPVILLNLCYYTTSAYVFGWSIKIKRVKRIYTPFTVQWPLWSGKWGYGVWEDMQWHPHGHYCAIPVCHRCSKNLQSLNVEVLKGQQFV